MAESIVNIELTTTEYRFLRSELELHAAALARTLTQSSRVKTMVQAPTPSERVDIRKRDTSLRAILKEI